MPTLPGFEVVVAAAMLLISTESLQSDGVREECVIFRSSLFAITGVRQVSLIGHACSGNGSERMKSY